MMHSPNDCSASHKSSFPEYHMKAEIGITLGMEEQRLAYSLEARFR